MRLADTKRSPAAFGGRALLAVGRGSCPQRVGSITGHVRPMSGALSGSRTLRLKVGPLARRCCDGPSGEVVKRRLEEVVIDDLVAKEDDDASVVDPHRAPRRVDDGPLDRSPKGSVERVIPRAHDRHREDAVAGFRGLPVEMKLVGHRSITVARAEVDLSDVRGVATRSRTSSSGRLFERAAAEPDFGPRLVNVPEALARVIASSLRNRGVSSDVGGLGCRRLRSDGSSRRRRARAHASRPRRPSHRRVSPTATPSACCVAAPLQPSQGPHRSASPAPAFSSGAP